MRIDNHTHVGFDPLFYMQGWSPYCLDLPRLFNEADGFNIDAFVVFPFVAYTALDMAAIKRNRIQLAADADAVPYEFENRRLCNDILRCPADWQSRLWPFLIADPSRKPEAQVRAWQALPSEYRIYGLKFQTHTIQSPILALLDEGACMLDYAEAHDLPLLIHTSIRAEDKWSQCSDILRVVESRPKVRFVLAHSCRFHQPTLDRVAQLPNAWFDCSAFITHCICAQRDLPAVAAPVDRFESDYMSPERVLQDLAQAYPDKLIWGSDVPYYSIEYDRLQIRSSYRREVACLDALPAPARERVCHRNTLAWLGSIDTSSS
ncbi:amidohydrolase family protein [Phycisphaerales bacterium AB-hyl4]|uniref:Amidohydrolase family protein n=1 Tax=Natronomicrosphaera hydrolytica TaxID=3242702 RepID=A0ABV4U2M4_9BACT